MATAIPAAEPVSAQINFTVSSSLILQLVSGLLCVGGTNLTAVNRPLSYKVLKNSASIITGSQNCRASQRWELSLRNITGIAPGDVISIAMWTANATWLEWDTNYLSESTYVFGIADTNAVRVDSADAASGEYLRFTTNGVEGRTKAEVWADISTGGGISAGEAIAYAIALG